MSKLEKGRLCAENNQELVVFMIGARVNKWWLLPLALPILSRMRAMQKELLADPESGLLGIESLGLADVQYWRSVDDLLAYADAKEREHKPTVKKFYQKIFRNEAVGIWHETFFVARGHYEGVYVNMPRRGLGAVFPLHPATEGQATSRGRLQQYFETRVPRPALGEKSLPGVAQ